MKPAPLSTYQVVVNGHRVRYRAGGSGNPVVLLHGLSGSSRWWKEALPALLPHFQVHLVDLPGFGSMAFGGRFVLADATTWLLEWMEAAGLEGTHLIGHFMGGQISLQVASTRPEIVQRLVLVAPSGIPAGHGLGGYVLPLLASLRYTSPRFLPVLGLDALRAGPVTLLRTARDIARDDVRPLLASITSPTLLIWGDRDRLVPIEAGLFLRRSMANARLLIIPRAGHVPMYDRPREFNDAVLAFLSGQSVGE
jgi:pimeloyl-ACP methyl ester carboxylesterase